jgi:hypothetical protein
MSPYKEEFDPPIVKVPAERVNFPDICPVCTSEATERVRVVAYPDKRGYLRPGWNPGHTPSARRRLDLPTPESRTFLVPVCEDHYYTGDVDWRLKTICVLANGISFSLLFFAWLNFANALTNESGIQWWIFGAGIFFAVTILAIPLAFGMNKLQKSLRIVGFDPAAQNVWIQLKNDEYREEFLKENAMDTELVSWVKRA